MDLGNFTDEQKLAITTVDNNLLVSASAGSGKTSVLVTRVCYLLQEKLASLNELLVVTFTNLASCEMKSRVKEMLENLAKTDSYYKSQLDLITTADISTLHKFCQKLIKEYFYEVSVDPNFEILDEGKSDYILNNILDKLIEQELKTNKEFLSLIMQFNDNRNDTKFRECVLKALKYLKSKQDYKEFCDKILNSTYSDNLDENIVISYLNSYIDSLLNYFKEKFIKTNMQATMLNSKKLMEINEFYLGIINMLLNKPFSDRFLIITSKIDYPVLSISKNSIVEEVELKEIMAGNIKQFKAELVNLNEILVFDNIELLKENIRKVSKKIKSFTEFVLKLDNEYMIEKQNEKVLDFADLEHFAFKILSNSRIRLTVQNRYKYIFIDEYQDTNEIQEKIISMVSNGKNLFMVGDMKQSIYGFRECKPEILNGKLKAFSKDENQGKAIKLNKNFRSSIDILNFCNFIFSTIMLEDSSGIDYDKEASFVFGGKTKQDSDSNVFIKIFNKQQPCDETVTSQYDKFSAKLDKNENNTIINEAKFVASEINKLIGTKIYDAKKGEDRVLGYNDIAVLTRKNANVVNLITETFKDYNIPFNAEISSNIFKSYENSVIFNLFKLVNNIDDDIALSSVLCSFMYKVSHQRLYEIKQKDKSMLQSIKEYIEKNDDCLKDTLNLLMKDIDYWRIKFNTSTLIDVFNEIVSHYKIELYLVANASDEKMSNLKLFEQHILSFNYLSLYDYVSFVINGQIDNLSNSSIANAKDSVSILTIHGSKGLEYPVVFLINAGGKFSNKSAQSKLVTNQDFGFAIKEFDEFNQVEEDSVIKNIFNLNNRQREVQEEMRLLYVALSRPKNKLYVIGSLDTDKVTKLNGSYEIMKSRNYLTWILGALTENSLQELKDNLKITTEYCGSKFEFEIIDKEITNEINSHCSFSKQLSLDESNIKYLKQTKRKSYLMLKNTVTAIMNTENENEDYNIKDFVYKTKKEEDNDFLLIGNMYHLVMEKIDVLSVIGLQDVENLLNQLVINNLASIEQIKLVDKQKILNCCQFIKSIASNQDIIYKEKSFMIYDSANNLVDTESSNKVLVQGTVDICIIKESEIILIDYKTTKASNEDYLTKHYSTQMNLYAKALQDYFGKPVYKKFIYSFYFDKPLIV